MTDHGTDGAGTGLEIAIVGMAGRFPGADDLRAFWRNLREGVESISFYSRGELLEAGADPELLDRPEFVPAQGELQGADGFDAALFGLTRRDAEILNPQHRVFLECAWAALEHAGRDPARLERPVGVFAGSGSNAYLERVVAAPGLVEAVGMVRALLGNEKDHLAAGAAYRLNLRGPAVSVQTACSTSLVAVHLACQSLINGECDLALAGGVSIPVPFRRGYLHTPDGTASPDGHVRAFDAASRGSVVGGGAGVVALRRLEDALADGDTVHAVIRGTAINNDGSQKVGYTAPSVAGQARVISEALAVAGVDAATLQYVETHGTGTPLGDAIELKALAQVLARGGGEPCSIGSVKTNLGHLDAAAGAAGLIKTVLALENAEIPPSLHCAEPNPEIAATGSRVVVNTELRPWQRNGTPRRAGVSSFGMGGTNAHVVLEEAPDPVPSGPSRAFQLLALSARTPTALAAAAGNLAEHLEALDGSPAELADAAYTLQSGRRELDHRLAVVCRDAREGAARLREGAVRAVRPLARTERPVAFVLPGVGTHYVDMGRGLYDAEPAYREAVDECCAVLRPLLGCDLREALFSASPGGGGGGWDLRALLSGDAAAEGAEEGTPLAGTRLAQPAVFVVEHALARLLASWGVRPRALLGHSVGEYVAACEAGVMPLREALELVALRARLVDGLPEGAMLAVPLSEDALGPLLPAALDVAAVNAPSSCVVSGPPEAVDAFAAELAARGTVSRRLPARHAFHSRAMEAVAPELERLAAGFTLRAPSLPLVSGVTGAWMTDDEACSPAYWARHLCRTVRFADGLATLRADPAWALLEVGPGQALGAWAAQPGPRDGGRGPVLSTLRHRHNRVPDQRFLLETLGALWTEGVPVDWAGFAAGERRRRVPLPGYPFERVRYWVDAPAGAERRVDGARAPEGGRGATSEKGPDEMENRPEAAGQAAAPSPRYHAVLGALTEISAGLTGAEPQGVDVDADFFSAGFDSLLLLQAIQGIEKRLGVRVSLVELLEEISTLAGLAAHLERVLPPDAPFFARTAPVPAASPVPAPTVAPPPPMPDAPRAVPAPPAFFPPVRTRDGADGQGSALERLAAQQLRVMEQQIAALRGEAGLAPAPVEAPAGWAAPAGTPASAAAEGAGRGAARPEPASVAAGVSSNGDGGAARAEVRVVPQSPRARIQPDTFVAYQPLNTEGAGGFTPRQRAYLDDFMARYVERTRASKAHQARYHLPLADTRVTARFRRAWKEILYPIVSRRARGARVWDLDGNEYVDTGMAFGCSLFGHAPDFISRAIAEQVERGYGVGPQSPHAGRAAELLCEIGGTERAVFCNSGTEAVMGAIRAARTYTGRNRVACFAGSYHGWADVVLGRMLTTAGGRREVRPSAPGISPAPLQDVLMLDWDQPSSLQTLAEHLDELAVVMVEPVQSRRLDIQPRAFLHELRRMTEGSGALLLFDELITGFRVAPGGAQAHFGVRADLVTYGKIVAGGLPMGVVAGTREVMGVFDGGLWNYGDDSYPTSQRTLFAGAFFKHPLSMAVACAVMEEVRRGGQAMYDRLNERTERLVERLNAYFEAGGYPVTCVRFASSFRFFFGPEVHSVDLFNHHLILEGVHVIPETGTHFLSTAHTDEDLEVYFQAVRRSLEGMRRGGFIPDAPGGDGGDGGDGDGGRGPDGGGPGGVRGRPGDRGDGASDRGLPSSGAGERGVGGGPAAGGSPVANGMGEGRGIAAAASRIDAGSGAGGEDASVRLLPLTDGQRQLWLESQMGDDACAAYVESAATRLRGPLDVEAMRRALAALVARHDALRTTFAAGGEAQVVRPPSPVEVPLVDFRAAPPAERMARADEWQRQAVRQPMDLVEGPLVRFALLALDADDHLLVTTLHHAVLDGWSSGVVLRDLGALYAAELQGRSADLPSRPDHGALVRAEVEAVERDAGAEAFWAAQFEDGAPTLELPTDRPRPAVRGYAGGRAERSIPASVAERLSAVGREHGLSLFHTFLAAFYAWLSRATGQHDLVVGVPSAGQAGAAGPAADLVGYGTSVLPIRMRVQAEQPFAEHARRVRGAVLRAVQHQGFSFPRLVERVLRGRDPARPPLFGVMLNVERAPEGGFPGGLSAAFHRTLSGGSKLDLNLSITETPRELRLACDYSSALFDAATVDAWLASFEALLHAVAADPRTAVAELDLLGEAGRDALEEWNETAAAYPRDRCIHELVREQAERTPDAVAVEWEGGALTCAELDIRAERLARHLAGLGVGPESRVGLFVKRGPEMVAGILGVLKAGGAYVPLDPDHPPGRLLATVEDAGLAVILTQSALVPALPQRAGTRIVVLDRDLPRDGAWDGALPSVDPASVAYVIYTSGSTGRPKGVMNTHGAVVNRLCWMQAEYGLGPGEGVLQKTPFSFDVSVWELFWPLIAGVRLVMARPGGHRDPAYLQDAVERHGITTLHFVPSMLREFVEAADPARCATLARVVCSGEALHPALADRFHERFPPPVELHNLYGPTEAAVDVSAWACPRTPGAAVPIGRPVWNTRLHVLDGGMRPLPVGVPGELHIGGVQVARGYLGRPALTAERFVPDPFDGSGGRLYRTGDRARWRADGAIEYLGRLDDQVKVRGFRVEPGEVEAALLRQAGVSACAVVARRQPDGDVRLAAYVAGAADPAALRAALRAALPEPMVPADFIVLPSLPLLASGKVDRRALPEPALPTDAGGGAAPRTPVEGVVAAAWCEVLGRDEVGVDDDFFALGGHSLLAVRVVSRIAAVVGVPLPLRDFFAGPTVARLAARVEMLRRAGAPPLPAIAPADRTRPLPLSFAQERLWFLDRLHPGSAFYNVPFALRLRGALDVPALERALGEVVRRHEVLRTTFRDVDGVAEQVVAPFTGFTLPVEELPADGGGAEEAVRALASEDAVRPFDLSAGPLFRARLVRVADGDHVLLACMHHAVSDGWSLGVLWREVSALYAALSRGEPVPLRDLALQYADFAAWQREATSAEAMERQLAWWRDRLAGAPALLELPTDHPRPAVQTFRGAHEPVRVPGELLRRLRALGHGEGATLYMVVLAAFGALLGRYADTDDVVLGSPAAGRPRREVEPLVGFFVNTLVLRADLSGAPTFRHLLGRVREATLGAWEHQDVPFERLVAELGPERSMGHSPLFQAMLALEEDAAGPPAGPPAGLPGLPGLLAQPVGAEPGLTKFDLTLSLAAGEDGLHGVLSYRTDLFEWHTAGAMVRRLGRLLEQAASRPDAPVAGLDLSEPGERQTLLEAWGAPDPVAAGDARPIHRLIEEQARRTPDAAAVVCGEREVTYAELDGRADALARGLRGLGAGIDSPVAVCMERGPELVAAILAVLKAGGAYVPLDPAYPAERLASTLAGSRARIVLVEGALPEGVELPEGAAAVDVASLAGSGGDDALPEVPPDALAYVVYTSGSTGTPKGVMVTHAGLVASTLARPRFYGGPVGRYLLLSPVAFDSSVAGLFWTLCTGGALVIPTPGEAHDADRLRALAERAGVTHLLALPSLYAELAREGGWGSRLATVIVAGEPCTAEVASLHAARFPAAELVNEYGPTEATVWSTAHRCGAGEAGASVPIGRPVAGVRAYVLDRALGPVPVGVPGELFVGGAQVARGYHDRPGATAERFAPDPFAGAGARMYRTGDRVRWRGDGVLEYLGRADQQVKVRGFRVEPGEVEAALRRHPAVRDCAVVARREPSGETALAAYVVGEGADPGALRAHLRGILPSHMVPATLTPLAALPLLPNGKLDRHALPAPQVARVDLAHDEPRNYVEAQLIPLWEEVLGRRGLGATQDFFELGGSSLLALALFSRANRRLGCDLPVATLFQGATVRQMADAVIAQREGGAGAPGSVVPLQPSGTLPTLFAVHSADRNVMGYVNLVRHLGPAQPVMGVRDVGDDMGRPVAEIAAEHVAAVRREQPSGPYSLLSWSYGGLVAFEMALQLERAGERVAFLGLLDTVSPAMMHDWWWDADEDVVTVLAGDVAARMRRPFAFRPDDVRGLDPDEQARRVVEAMHAQGAAPPGYEAATLAAQCREVRDRRRSREGYQPGRFGGALTLFRATDVPPDFADFLAAYDDEERRTLGWSRYVDGPVEVHTVPGSHPTLGSEPHVQVLAERMRASLADARDRAAAPPSPMVASTSHAPDLDALRTAAATPARAGRPGPQAARSSHTY